jgi:molybdenum cofactor cytidylyltransferase
MVAAIILAAGRSTRMGHSKPLLAYGAHPGETFLSRLTGNLKAAGLNVILVVGRGEDAPLRTEVARCGASYTENPAADEGQLSSLLAGLTELEARHGARLQAVMVMPVDAPLISTAAVQRLLQAAKVSIAPILRATHAGQHGHPVLFRRCLFAELHAADATVGARAVVRADPARVEDVDVGEAGVTIDFDTPEEYRGHFGAWPFTSR